MRTGRESGLSGTVAAERRNWYTRIQETGLYLTTRLLTRQSIVICRPIK
ncbi:hypothetical protein ACVXG8_09415 [Escherichia coli]